MMSTVDINTDSGIGGKSLRPDAVLPSDNSTSASVMIDSPTVAKARCGFDVFFGPVLVVLLLLPVSAVAVGGCSLASNGLE